MTYSAASKICWPSEMSLIYLTVFSHEGHLSKIIWNIQQLCYIFAMNLHRNIDFSTVAKQ